MDKIDATIAHRQAGLIAGFMWQDEEADGGDSACVDTTSIVGTLPDEVNGSPVYLVHVEGTADSGFGYFYSVDRDVKVELMEDGKPLVSDASDEEVQAAIQHGKDEACKEYAELTQAESDSERRKELDTLAIELGLQFSRQEDGSYALVAAPPEMIEAYEQSREDEDEDEE